MSMSETVIEVTDGNFAEEVEQGEGLHMIDFWATWCGPCVGEILFLNQLHADYESEGLVVVSLANEPRDDLLNFDEAQPVETVSVHSESVDWCELGEARPVTFFIDRQRVLRE